MAGSDTSYTSADDMVSSLAISFTTALRNVATWAPVNTGEIKLNSNARIEESALIDKHEQQYYTLTTYRQRELN